MKWIKASERLPVEDKPKIIKVYNEVFFASYRNKIWFKPGTNYVLIMPDNNGDYEWLDETQSPPTQMAEGVYTFDDMMNIAGWMAAADCKRPIHELKEEAEVYIYKIKHAALSAPKSEWIKNISQSGEQC